MEEIDFVLSRVKTFEPSWSKVTSESCKFIRLVGNSSRVFLFETSLQVNIKRFIYRVFGSGDTIDIATNTVVFRRLAENKVAPKIYLETRQYRFEEYLEGSRNLLISEIVQPRIGCKISKKLREFHSTDMSDLLNRNEPVCVSNAQKWRRLSSHTLQTLTTRATEKCRAEEALGDEYYNMFTEILPKDSPIVFSHMDTSFLNMLYKEEKEEICLIDYDYSGYCYRGFDIAMLLQDIKYNYNYPRYPFYEYIPENYGGDTVLARYIKDYGEGVDMFVECKRCMAATHYMWAMWAFSLASDSNEGMDMLGYGLLRFEEFLEAYEEFKNDGIENLRAQAAQSLAIVL